jgi:hypothetical protein
VVALVAVLGYSSSAARQVKFHMKSRWTLSWVQLVGVLLYAVLVASFLGQGGALNTIGIVAGAPFLPFGYLTGSLGQSALGGAAGYLLGIAVGVAFQAWVVLVLAVSWRKWRRRAT